MDTSQTEFEFNLENPLSSPSYNQGPVDFSNYSDYDNYRNRDDEYKTPIDTIGIYTVNRMAIRINYDTFNAQQAAVHNLEIAEADAEAASEALLNDPTNPELIQAREAAEEAYTNVANYANECAIAVNEDIGHIGQDLQGEQRILQSFTYSGDYDGLIQFIYQHHELTDFPFEQIYNTFGLDMQYSEINKRFNTSVEKQEVICYVKMDEGYEYLITFTPYNCVYEAGDLFYKPRLTPDYKLSTNLLYNSMIAYDIHESHKFMNVLLPKLENIEESPYVIRDRSVEDYTPTPEKHPLTPENNPYFSNTTNIGELTQSQQYDERQHNYRKKVGIFTLTCIPHRNNNSHVRDGEPVQLVFSGNYLEFRDFIIGNYDYMNTQKAPTKYFLRQSSQFPFKDVGAVMELEMDKKTAPPGEYLCSFINEAMGSSVHHLCESFTYTSTIHDADYDFKYTPYKLVYEANSVFLTNPDDFAINKLYHNMINEPLYKRHMLGIKISNELQDFLTKPVNKKGKIEGRDYQQAMERLKNVNKINAGTKKRKHIKRRVTHKRKNTHKKLGGKSKKSRKNKN